MIRARERGMSYWPFVICLIALLVMTYMWYEASKDTDGLRSDLSAANREKAELTTQLTSTRLTLDELQSFTGFSADDGRKPDGEKMRARVQEFVQQTGDQLTFTIDAKKWTASGQGGRVEELNDGQLKVHYFPPAGEMSGDSLRGALLLSAQLGMSMEIAAQRDDSFSDLGRE